MNGAKVPAVRRLDDDALQPSGDVHMSYVYPWEGVVQTPFGSGWAVVGPGERTERHMHHEGETWFVMEGTAVLTVDGTSQEVGPGDTVFLPPFRSHTLDNPSPTARVVFLTVWWEDAALTRANLGEGAQVRRAQAALGGDKSRRVVVYVGPPTPNGDLHLGHLSGPCLAADVYCRALGLEGADAALVMSTDDYQSYVAGKALKTGRKPADLADHFAARMLEALATADVHPEECTRPIHAKGYTETIQEIFIRLYQAGHIVAKETPCLRDPDDGRYLFEFYVYGRCPHCGAAAGGGGCEDCGRPNDTHDLVEPRTTLGDKIPVRDTVTRLVIPLANHAELIRAWLDGATVSPHLRAIVEAALEAGLPDFPATHPHDWGIPCPVAGFEDQVISSYVELAHGTLVTLRDQALRSGRTVDSSSLVPMDAPEIAEFFGLDAGFFYAVLRPTLLALADPAFSPPNEYFVNEFYLLEGEKFSTSRGHAVWIRDICEREPSDLVRFYVCHTRPEQARTDFTEVAYRRFVDESIRGAWGDWLQDLDERLDAMRDRVAPEPGYWMAEHKAFLAFLEGTTHSLREAYAARSFSTRRATRALLALVDEACAFAAGQRHFATVPKRTNELRTALALELAAARLLALGVAPIMPRFAERLFRGLGDTQPVAEAGWPQGHTWVAEGTKVDLREVGFPPRED